MRTLVLDSTLKMPLYEQLYRGVKEQILEGQIAGGEKLPSKRALAELLNISCITVENAYEQLLAEGYLISKPRSGYYAQELSVLPQGTKPKEPMPYKETAMAPSASAAHFPFSVWAKLMRGVLLDAGEQLLQPAPNIGLYALRRAIAAQLGRSRGFAPDPDCIIIGAGAEYLYNILIQLLGREHRYGLEDPGHGKIAKVYEANGVEVLPVALDEYGVSMGALEESGATVMHLSPGHQFPTGIITPIRRRSELMAWLAEGADRWIIEDDYDTEFRFGGRPIPSMFSMDEMGKVIYMNTFSKTITPALRISYMILPPELMERYHKLLGFYSCTVPSFEQLTLARFLDEGFFDKHIGRMRRHYRSLRDEFLSGLSASSCAASIEVRGHEAGLHMLLQLPMKAEKAEQELTQIGIHAVALHRYAKNPAAVGQQGALVLHYSDLTKEQIPALIKVLEELTT